MEAGRGSTEKVFLRNKAKLIRLGPHDPAPPRSREPIEHASSGFRSGIIGRSQDFPRRPEEK